MVNTGLGNITCFLLATCEPLSQPVLSWFITAFVHDPVLGPVCDNLIFINNFIVFSLGWYFCIRCVSHN